MTIQQKLTPEEAEEVARIMVLQDVPMDENVLMDYVKRFRLADFTKAVPGAQPPGCHL